MWCDDKTVWIGVLIQYQCENVCIYKGYSIMGVWVQYLYESVCVRKGCSLMSTESSAFHSTDGDRQDDEAFIEHSEGN